MSTAVASRRGVAPLPATPPFWVGDPSILVFATRYALTARGHVAEFVRQSIAANAEVLTGAARRLIVRDITAWLDYDGATAPAADRAVWIAALAALGVEA